MALPKDQFDHLFNQLPEQDKKSLLDYMEYLVARAAKKAWDDIPEVDEPLTDEEKAKLARAKEDDESISLEDLKSELNL
ncbi:hypothetical protein DNHGIG_22320 [Collibacillus ludicampi]|uniref:DUF2281 domain-containing protein n=1 Tax=Collibacillus ludicampi TaxID=2771369 RepID=A0AAV4LG48_9BACL|nr:hypothetical protein [Collibacillus ludicampi]GIM46683.1 hypothetical protein DNHGIG_22320 [Collibacillus ludicampi]